MQEVAAIEKSRQTPEACRMIHLFDFGKFISAFDWSVWLLERCGVDLRQCLVKNNSFGGQVIRVGFPNKPDSWQKYMPNFIVRDNSSTEKHIIWNLPDTAFKPDETPEVMKRQYDEWVKASLPKLIEKAKNQKKADAQRQSRAQQVPVRQPQNSAPAWVPYRSVFRRSRMSKAHASHRHALRTVKHEVAHIGALTCCRTYLLWGATPQSVVTHIIAPKGRHYA